MGKITVIGIGPGSMEDMTPKAKKAIEAAEVVASSNSTNSKRYNIRICCL